MLGARIYFHEIYCEDFILKQEIQFTKNLWSLRFFPKSPWLLWKSTTRYFDWVLASSNVQRFERVLTFVQSIEWIVDIKYIPNIEWVSIFKYFLKNIWSVILEKTCQNFDSQGTYRSPLKFDFEQLKDIITANWRNNY